jgi:hypothetical protein
MATDKLPTSYRLSDEARGVIGRLAELHGCSGTDVVERAVRLLARIELADYRPGPDTPVEQAGRAALEAEGPPPARPEGAAARGRPRRTR